MVATAGAFAAAAGAGVDVAAGVRAVMGGADCGDDCADEFGVAAVGALPALAALVALFAPGAADVAFSELIAPAEDLPVGAPAVAAAGVGVDDVAVAPGALLATAGMAVA